MHEKYGIERLEVAAELLRRLDEEAKAQGEELGYYIFITDMTCHVRSISKM